MPTIEYHRRALHLPVRPSLFEYPSHMTMPNFHSIGTSISAQSPLPELSTGPANLTHEPNAVTPRRRSPSPTFNSPRGNDSALRPSVRQRVDVTDEPEPRYLASTSRSVNTASAGLPVEASDGMALRGNRSMPTTDVRRSGPYHAGGDPDVPLYSQRGTQYTGTEPLSSYNTTRADSSPRDNFARLTPSDSYSSGPYRHG
jgi:hypothetical protein